MKEQNPYRAVYAVLLTSAVLAALVWLFSFSSTSAWLEQRGLQFTRIQDFIPQAKDSSSYRITKKAIDTVSKSLSQEARKKLDTLKSKIEFLSNQSLENGQTSLSVFFDALGLSSDSMIHIWYYGDSQVEGDRITQDLRPLFQGKFGGNGIGYLPFSDVATYRDIETETSENWIKHNVFMHRKSRGFGFSGINFLISNNDSQSVKPFTRIKSRYNATFPATYLLYGKSGGGSISVEDQTNKEKNSKTELKPSESAGMVRISSGFRKMLKVEYDCRGTTFFGYMIGTGKGVYIDNCGIRGHSGDGLFNISNNMLAMQSKMMNTRLIVFHYGNNAIPYIRSKKHAEFVGKEFEKLFRKFRNAIPNASILVVSGGDMGKKQGDEEVPYENAALLAQIMEETALKNGCAFFDMYALMKKDGGILGWKKKGWANLDGHLTPAGQAKFAKTLFTELMREYAVHQIMISSN